MTEHWNNKCTMYNDSRPRSMKHLRWCCDFQKRVSWESFSFSCEDWLDMTLLKSNIREMQQSMPLWRIRGWIIGISLGTAEYRMLAWSEATSEFMVHAMIYTSFINCTSRKDLKTCGKSISKRVFVSVGSCSLLDFCWIIQCHMVPWPLLSVVIHMHHVPSLKITPLTSPRAPQSSKHSAKPGGRKMLCGNVVSDSILQLFQSFNNELQ